MRIQLDSNLWSRLADWGESQQFETWVRAHGLTVLAPPSILVEVLRTGNDRARDRIISVMTSGPREYLLPEARLEADEFVAMVRHYRPDWLRRFPRTDRLQALETFWTKRVWQHAKLDSREIASRVSPPEIESQRIRLLEVARDMRQTVRAQDVQPDVLELVVDVSRSRTEAQEGWAGGQIEAWRFELDALFWYQLVTVPSRRAFAARVDTTYADWIDPWVKLATMTLDRSAYNRLWYYEVDRAILPRNWLRWAVRWAQTQMKITDGNPADEQHAAYLFDADVFFTADGRFARALEDVRAKSPAPFARVAHLKPSGSVVAALELALSAIS
jgi:hypothetical protein